MRFCYMQLNDGKTINVTATRIELTDNMFMIYNGTDLVGCADIGVVLYAQLNER